MMPVLVFGGGGVDPPYLSTHTQQAHHRRTHTSHSAQQLWTNRLQWHGLDNDWRLSALEPLHACSIDIALSHSLIIITPELLMCNVSPLCVCHSLPMVSIGTRLGDESSSSSSFPRPHSLVWLPFSPPEDTRLPLPSSIRVRTTQRTRRPSISSPLLLFFAPIDRRSIRSPTP